MVSSEAYLWHGFVLWTIQSSIRQLYGAPDFHHITGTEYTLKFSDHGIIAAKDEDIEQSLEFFSFSRDESLIFNICNSRNRVHSQPFAQGNHYGFTHLILQRRKAYILKVKVNQKSSTVFEFVHFGGDKRSLCINQSMVSFMECFRV